MEKIQPFCQFQATTAHIRTSFLDFDQGLVSDLRPRLINDLAIDQHLSGTDESLGLLSGFRQAAG
jgi:hypothetical protein